MFILMRGELHVVDLDHETFLSKIPEGGVFGEGTVLRHLEVSALCLCADSKCNLLCRQQADTCEQRQHLPVSAFAPAATVAVGICATSKGVD